MYNKIVLIFLLILGVALAAPVAPINPTITQELVKVDKVAIFSGLGNVTFQTGSIVGELLAIGYQNGNFTGGGEIYVNATYPFAWPITSYNLSSGNNFTDTTRAFYKMPIVGKVNLSLYNAQTNKSANVYIMYR